jgi:hypothetical protein
MATTTPPRILKTAGRKFWRDVTAKWDLRADELRTLESACRSLDMVDLVTKEWTDNGSPLTSHGSMGQLVEHPNIASIDKAQKAFELYVKRLALPDEGTGAAEAPNQQRDAAQTRWAAAHGRSA